MLDIPRPPESETNPLLTPTQQVEYQAKVGSCLWVTNGTRSDSLFAVNSDRDICISPLVLI